MGPNGGSVAMDLNGERFKPVFAERDKKQTKIDLRGISSLLKAF
jgi:hypothetical protein